MKYLEKYIFQLLPDITKLSDFPHDITDDSIADYFGYTLEERIANTKLAQKAIYFYLPVIISPA